MEILEILFHNRFEIFLLSHIASGFFLSHFFKFFSSSFYDEI